MKRINANVRPNVVFVKEALSIVWTQFFTKLGRINLMQNGVLLIGGIMVTLSFCVYMAVLYTGIFIALIWTNWSA
jgi:hypothetical protein